MMMEIIYILCLIIIKSEVWTITRCLRLGYETMVCAVCLSIFLSVQLSYLYKISETLELAIELFKGSYTMISDIRYNGLLFNTIWLYDLYIHCPYKPLTYHKEYRLGDSLWKCSQENAKEPQWWEVCIGSGNGLMQSRQSMALSKPMLIKIYVAIRRH